MQDKYRVVVRGSISNIVYRTLTRNTYDAIWCLCDRLRMLYSVNAFSVEVSELTDNGYVVLHTRSKYHPSTEVDTK